MKLDKKCKRYRYTPFGYVNRTEEINGTHLRKSSTSHKWV